MWQMASPSSISFFFQAEDGIRGGHVTGVQTCALPISRCTPCRVGRFSVYGVEYCRRAWRRERSEERRVGKEGRYRWWAADGKEIVYHVVLIGVLADDRVRLLVYRLHAIDLYTLSTGLE